MARTRRPHVIKLTADHLFVTAPDGTTTMDILARMNVPAGAPAFTGVYVVPGLPTDGPPPLYWGVLAEQHPVQKMGRGRSWRC
jgi:hypothetical protein